MTDKQDTHDRTHTTGHAEGRRRASGAHTQRTDQGTGTGNTTEHSRRRTAATEHTAGRRIGGQAEGRKGGERDTDGRAPGEWRREARRRHTAAGREQGEIMERADRQKKVCNIFKGEMRGKTPPRLAKACKRVYIHIT